MQTPKKLELEKLMTARKTRVAQLVTPKLFGPQGHGFDPEKQHLFRLLGNM